MAENRRVRIVPWKRPQRLFLYGFVTATAINLVVTVLALTRI